MLLSSPDKAHGDITAVVRCCGELPGLLWIPGDNAQHPKTLLATHADFVGRVGTARAVPTHWVLGTWGPGSS